MELTGKVIAVLPLREGTSQKTGNAWKSQDYVIETVNEQYPRRMCFNLFGDKIDLYKLQDGELVTVSFDIEADEYQGRWYNRIRAWKIERGGDAAPAASVSKAAPVTPTPLPVNEPSTAEDTSSDLPF